MTSRELHMVFANYLHNNFLIHNEPVLLIDFAFTFSFNVLYHILTFVFHQ